MMGKKKEEKIKYKNGIFFDFLKYVITFISNDNIDFLCFLIRSMC